MRIAGRKADEADAEGVKTGSREEVVDMEKNEERRCDAI